jgi:hypothetical protein
MSKNRWDLHAGRKLRDAHRGAVREPLHAATVVNVTDGEGRGIQLGGAGTLFFAKNWSATRGYAADIH